MAETHRGPELWWQGKRAAEPVAPGALLEVEASSLRPTESENLLIHGDNLPVLATLRLDYAARIKCVYIDPPFNTGQSMQHYDDGVEHASWLHFMQQRLMILRELLAPDGAIFVHIDDNELGYLIVLLDEIFGRENRAFVATFKQASATGHKAINPGCVNTSNFVLAYAKQRSAWRPKRLFTPRRRDVRYSQFIPNIEELPERWRITTLSRALADALGSSEREARRMIRDDPERVDAFVTKHARRVIQLARPNYGAVSAAVRALIDASAGDPSRVYHLERKGRPDFYLIGGRRILFYANKLKEIDGRRVAGEPLTTIWDDLLSNNLHHEGGVAFPKGKKPEALLKRIVELSTEPGEWVLDCFAGSGTTGAVAHKMGRRWIMVESGDHCLSHIVPRMRAVAEGRDASGVTVATNWRGGGGFRLYRLAPAAVSASPSTSERNSPPARRPRSRNDADKAKA